MQFDNGIVKAVLRVYILFFQVMIWTDMQLIISLYKYMYKHAITCYYSPIKMY